MVRSTSVALSVIVLAVCISLTPVYGNDQTYWRHDPAVPDNWYDQANWTNGVPVNRDYFDAYVDNGGISEINYGAARAYRIWVGGTDDSIVRQNVGTDVEVKGIFVAGVVGTTGLYEMNGGALRCIGHSSDQGLKIGSQGDGTFRQTDGSLTAKNIVIGIGVNDPAIVGQGLFELIGGTVSNNYTIATVGRNGVYRQTGGLFDFQAPSKYYPFQIYEGAQWQLGGDGVFQANYTKFNSSLVGSVVQSGGTGDFGKLIIGDGSGQSGTYLLSGGELDSESTYLGYRNGAGVFRQTGGTHDCGSLLVSSDTSSSLATGSYELVDGSLEADRLRIGYDGHGVFKQTGGTNSAVDLYIMDRYEYSGGRLEVSGRLNLSGELDLLGSVATVYGLDGAWLDLSSGTIDNAASGGLDCSENSVTVISSGTDLGAIFGTLDIRGAVHTLGETLVVPAGSVIVTSGGIADHVRCAGSLSAPQGQSLNLQNGLEIDGLGAVDLGSGELTVFDPASGMTGGSLSGSREHIKPGAKFTQSGGSVNLRELWLYGYDEPASYEMSGGDLTVTDDIVISEDSNSVDGGGHFRQTDGVVVANKQLIVGTTFGDGTYELVGGRFSTDMEYVGQGNNSNLRTGFMRQEGGSNSTRELYVGRNSAYEMSGGRLDASEKVLIWGRMSQTGGTVVIGDELIIRSASGVSLYELGGGDLMATAEFVGDSIGGRFLQTGGTNTAGSLTIVDDANYEFSGGILRVNDQLILEGQLDFADADGQLILGDGATANLTLGEILNASLASMIVGSDSDVFFPAGFNPYLDFELYQSSGRTHLAGDVLDVPAGQTLHLGGEMHNRVRCAGTVLPLVQADGVDLAAGVEVLGGGDVDISVGTLGVSDDKSLISGGSLAGLNLEVGSADGTAAFTHSDGEVVFERLDVGFTADRAGRYELGGGRLNVEDAFIGYFGSGLFKHTGGIFNSVEPVYLGGSVGSSGIYEMSGGILNADVHSQFRGEIQFLHSGGTVNGDILISNIPADSIEESKYEMSGTASLNAGDIGVAASLYGSVGGAGRFVQASPDTTVVTGELFVGQGGTYELIDGLLSAGSENVYEGGVFRQSGGRNQAGDIVIANTGRYEYTGGELSFENMIVDGVFDLSDQAVAVSIPSGVLDISQGSFEGGRFAELHLGSQSLLIVAPGADPGTAFGVFSNQGLLHTPGTRLVVPHGRGFTGNLDTDDFVECRGVILASPGGALNLNGGLALHGGTVGLGRGEAKMGSDGGITGGQLLGGTLRVDTSVQSGGLVTSNLVVGTHFTLNGGWIDTRSISGLGEIVQNDGEVQAAGIVIGRFEDVIVPAYTINGGQLTAGYFQVGDEHGRAAALCLTGGQAAIAGELLIGGPFSCLSAGMGRVELGGAATLSAAEVYVGSRARGEFIQAGGIHTVDKMHVGRVASGYYELQAGELNGTEMRIGCINGYLSSVVQTGGSATLNGDLICSENGVYDLRSGFLNVLGTAHIGGFEGTEQQVTTSMCLISGGRSSFDSLIVGKTPGAEKGRLSILSTDAQIEVRRELVLGPRAEFTAIPGAVIRMTGSSCTNQSTDAAALAGLGNLTLVFEGGSDVIDPFEVAGQDMGPVLDGFYENFALGTLKLGGSDVGMLGLCDLFDNGQDGSLDNEALYVANLEIGDGSYLDLNGLNLYYRKLKDLGGTIVLNGGSMTQVPEPGTLLMLAAGLPVIIRRIRRKA
jgi:hypothetical protein